MIFTFDNSENKEHLYLQVYHYYRDLILSRRLPPGSRMPSLRTCARDLHLSRTTVESAYLQLAADGYIVSRAQSGYYVTDIARQQPSPHKSQKPELPPVRYNFASSGVDRESFRFDLWQRYLKSALRQNDRLLSYGEPQGEADFRQVLSDYVRQGRNITCSPDDIVIGAGVQSLLHILCPLIRDKKTVSFPTSSFIQGSTVFSDYGFDVRYRNKDSGVIYVSPAHMTKWGEIMPVSRRMELLRHVRERNSLIIEDDFENEFVYLQKPTPSLFSLSGGRGVVYIGSFSRLLLPSIRISFMILPPELSLAYQKKSACYNQTASKAEQIALCQFIRDGHLAGQIRKVRKLYTQKARLLETAVREAFGKAADVRLRETGFVVQVRLRMPLAADDLEQRARKAGVSLRAENDANGACTLFLACSGVRASDFPDAAARMRAVCLLRDTETPT